jgi:hypothetical protein
MAFRLSFNPAKLFYLNSQFFNIDWDCGFDNYRQIGNMFYLNGNYKALPIKQYQEHNLLNQNKAILDNITVLKNSVYKVTNL